MLAVKFDTKSGGTNNQQECSLLNRKATGAILGGPFIYDHASVSCDLETCFVRNSLGVIRLAEVRVQEGEGIESALRRFKRKVQTEEIIKEVKRHSYYLKPGAKRRVKQALARKRALKKIRKERD